MNRRAGGTGEASLAQVLFHLNDMNDEYEFSVQFTKNSRGLGFTISSYIGDLNSVYSAGVIVKSIVKGSTVDQDGRIHIGDIILSVDGVSLQGCSEQRAMEVLRRTGPLVRLRLLRKAVRLSHIRLPPVPPLQPLRHSHSLHEGNPYRVGLNKIQETGGLTWRWSSTLKEPRCVCLVCSAPATALISGDEEDDDEVHLTPEELLAEFNDDKLTLLPNMTLGNQWKLKLPASEAVHHIMTFDPNDRNFLYLMTSHHMLRVRVAECDQWKSCSDCLGAGDAHCGWCTLENSPPGIRRGDSASSCYPPHLLQSPVCPSQIPGPADPRSVCGVDLRDASHEQAVEAIRRAGDTVVFLVQSGQHRSQSPMLTNHERLTPTPHSNSHSSKEAQPHGGLFLSLSPTNPFTPTPFKVPSPTSNRKDQRSPVTVTSPITAAAEDEDDAGMKKMLQRYGSLSGKLHMIELEKDPAAHGLGISLRGNKDGSRARMSVYVADVDPQGPAGLDGRIRVGDEL
ncbi:multiple PDZ domain protein-like protein, partial [Lates japonicus]